MCDFDSGRFWEALDKLVLESEIAIDRPRGTAHPRYPHTIYPLDYGHLKGTASMDGGGIDLWAGTGGTALDALLCTVDPLKRDAELKLLLGCTEAEKTAVLQFHRRTLGMGAILVRR